MNKNKPAYLGKIKQARETKKYTQAKMALLLGLKSKVNYWHIENGTIKITIELAKKICSILDLEISIFFVEEVQETQTKVKE